MSTTNGGNVPSLESITTEKALESKSDGSSAGSKRKEHEQYSERQLYQGFRMLFRFLRDPPAAEFENIMKISPYFQNALDKFNDQIQSGMKATSDPEVGAAVACFLNLHWYPDAPWEWSRILNGQEAPSGFNYPLLDNKAILHAKIYSYADHWHLNKLKAIAFQRFLVAFATLNRCGTDSFNAKFDSSKYNIFNEAYQFTSQDRDLMDAIIREVVSDESIRKNRDILRVFLYGLIRFRDSSRGNYLCTWYQRPGSTSGTSTDRIHSRIMQLFA